MILRLNFNDIRTKKDLIKLFINQLSEKQIRFKINKILECESSEVPLSNRRMQKNISSQQVMLFIIANGVPDGYLLSQEMQVKIVELKKDLAVKSNVNYTETHES